MLSTNLKSIMWSILSAVLLLAGLAKAQVCVGGTPSTCGLPTATDSHIYDAPTRTTAFDVLDTFVRYPPHMPAVGYSSRAREVPIRFRIPRGGPALKRPIVLLVHGGAEGSSSGHTKLANWAQKFLSRGYVTINIGVEPRSLTEKSDLCRALGMEVYAFDDDGPTGWSYADECKYFRYLMYDRPHDIHVVLDQLRDLESLHPELSQNFNFDPDGDVVLFGHSAGSEGVQSAASVTRDFDYDGVPEVNLHYHDLIKGVIAASPKGPFSPLSPQNPTQPGCEVEKDCTVHLGGSCSLPFPGRPGSCVAPVCPYGSPVLSPACDLAAPYGDLCRRDGNLGFTTSSWTELVVPTLYLTGSKDFAGAQHPSERRWAAEHPGRASSFLLWFDDDPSPSVDLGHDFYALGRSPWDPYYEERMVSTALAFVDSVAGVTPDIQLRGQDYLARAGPTAGDGRGTVEFGCY